MSWTCSSLLRNTPSVISSSSRLAARPVSLSTVLTTVGSASDLNWTGERLTATEMCLRPFRRLGAGRPQHPFADLVDQADFLRERDEQRGADGPVLGMIPADQRLEAGDRLARSIDLRLVDDPQLAFLERDAKVRSISCRSRAASCISGAKKR